VHTIREAGDLNCASYHRAAGGCGHNGDGGRRTVGIASDEVDRGTAVSRRHVSIRDGEIGRGVAVEIGELAVDTAAIFGITKKWSLRPIGGGIDCLGIAKLVG